MSRRIWNFGQRNGAAEVAAAVSPARWILASASRKRPCAKPRVFHSVHGDIGRPQRAASDASTLVRDRRSPRRSGVKHAHCADREASQSRTVEIARVKSACGRRAMTSHLNAW